MIPQIQSVASTPYQSFAPQVAAGQGELVAPVNSQQYQGIGGVNQYANAAQPYLQQAGSLAASAAQPLSQSQINQYENPYTQQVVGATQQQFNQMNQQALNNIQGSAAASGALGGNRDAVAQSAYYSSVLPGQEQQIAGLESSGYQQGVQTAEQQQQNELAGAYGLGNIGQSVENAGLTGATAQIGAGTLEQQTQQALDTAQLQQYEQAQQYPFATTGWEAGLLTGVGSQMGGTSETTAPAPNQTAQYLGAGISALGLFANRGGAVRGLATGGASMPYGDITGWVPTINITTGQGAPKPPSVQSQGNNSQSGFANFANDAKIGKTAGQGLSNLGTDVNNLIGSSDEYGGGNILSGDVSGGSASNPLPGLDASDYGEKRGGAVLRAYGGLAIPNKNRITVPMRGGLGMSSFVPRRKGGLVRGYDDGGNVDDAAANFDPATYAPTSELPAWLPQAQQIQQSVAPTAGLVQQSPPPSVMPQSQSEQPNANNPTGLFSQKEQQYDLPSGYLANTAQTESGMNPHAYNEFSHAAGLFQFTPSTARQYGLTNPNDPVASTDAAARLAADNATVLRNGLGRDPTAGELYLAHQQGATGALRLLTNPNARAADLVGTRAVTLNGGTPDMTAAQFAGHWTGRFSGQPGTQVAQNIAPNTASDAPLADVGTTSASGSSAGQSNQSHGLFNLFGMSPDMKATLLSAGLGMMASRSPFLGVAIGEGGQQGLQTYGNLQAQHIQQSEKQQDIDLKVQQLKQQAKAEQDRIAQESRPYGEMTAAQKADLEFKERAELRQEMQPVKIGTDMSTGMDIYGVRDPQTGGFRRIDPSTGALGASMTPQASAPASAIQAPPTSATAAQPTTPQQSAPNQQVASAAQSDADAPPNVRQEVLSSLDPQVAATVKALDEGRMQFPTGFALKSPYWQNMLRLVANYDPSFDAVNYNARAKTRADFVAGKSAQNITSFNTAIGHLDTLDKSIDALNNTSFPAYNKFANWAAIQSGDARFQQADKDFMAAKQAVTDELTRAFRGSGGNVHDIVGWENTLNEADSPQALHEAVKTAVNLLRSRIESVGDQYNRGMGTTRDPLTLLSPHAAATVQRLSGEGGAQPSAVSPTPPMPGAKLFQGKWYTRGPNGEAVPVQ